MNGQVTPISTRSALRELNGFGSTDTREATVGIGARVLNPFPTPSPDEQVIRLRGRRIFPVERSPRKARSPPASPRRSPRKSPSKYATTPVKSPRKRVRANLMDDDDERPAVWRLPRCLSWSAPVRPMLEVLSRKQLVDLLDNMVQNVSGAEQAVRDTLPTPDLSEREERLQLLKRNIYTSFPRNRFGSRRDAFCYHRVASHVDVFKKECLAMGRELLATEQWTTVIEYVFLAWQLAQDLPDWENPGHNKAKQMCLKTLAGFCLRALKHDALPKDQYKRVLDRLQLLSDGNTELNACIEYVREATKKTK